MKKTFFLLALAVSVRTVPVVAEWVRPQGFPDDHNGGFLERLTQPAHPEGKKPHILMLLFDDFGWANAGWHRNYTAPGGEHVPYTAEVQTPAMDALVRE